MARAGEALARRRVRALLLLAAAAALGWLALALGWGGPRPLDPDPDANPGDAPGPAFARRAGVKYILLWNEYFHYENLGFGAGAGEALFRRLRCPAAACHMTRDRALLPSPRDFDAVVFHMYYFRLHRLLPFLDWGKLPPVRAPHQRYVFFLLESPANCGSAYGGMQELFNWTMTYRQDSDVPAPYGEVHAKAGVPDPKKGWLTPPALAPQPPLDHEHTDSGRRRREGDGAGSGPALVAWLVSHCSTQSLRENLVARLRRHVDVHVFGGCGAPWPKDDLPGFYRMLQARGYKFYLSFENSLCKDYVTEKLFNILQLDVVPVVYGAANYSAVVPPQSYIDARAFASPRHLARYLQFLARRPREYAKFFWWKRHYEVVPHPHGALCRLCEKLHEPARPQTYADMAQWWNGQGVCQEPDASLTDLGG